MLHKAGKRILIVLGILAMLLYLFGCRSGTDGPQPA